MWELYLLVCHEHVVHNVMYTNTELHILVNVSVHGHNRVEYQTHCVSSSVIFGEENYHKQLNPP